MDKKGQGMSITTLILIVLGIAILVVVIIGFSMGWSNLTEKFNIFRPSTNIDDLVQGCSLVVTQPGAYCEFKTVTLEGKKQYVNCEDSRISAKLQTGAPPVCDVTPAQFCSGKPATALVNGKACSVLNPAAYPNAKPAAQISSAIATPLASKVLDNLAKSESYKSLVVTYSSSGSIDLQLLLDNYLRAEYGVYNSNTVFKDYDAFYNYRKIFIDKLKASMSIVSMDYAYLIKDKGFELLGVNNYNQGTSNLVNPFADKKIQCQSATRLFITSALEILNPSLSDRLLIIYTSGHTLPGYIDDNGNLIGIEATAEGKSLVDFGKVKADKSLEGQTEQIVAKKAKYELLYGILTDNNLKNDVNVKSTVVYNKGNIVNEGTGSIGINNNLPSNAFGSVNVPSGDIKIGRIDTTSQFTGMKSYSANIGGSESSAGVGTGTTSSRQEYANVYSYAKTDADKAMLDKYYAVLDHVLEEYYKPHAVILYDKTLSDAQKYQKVKPIFDAMQAEYTKNNNYVQIRQEFFDFAEKNTLEVVEYIARNYNVIKSNMNLWKENAGL